MSVAVLLFVFFLPLHFHPVAATPQAAKECTCAHGTRAQLAPAPDIGSYAPILKVSLVIAQNSWFWSDEWIDLQRVRGPPASLHA